jgi:carboxypeptidase Q
MRDGVTGASLNVDFSHYFDIHHTQADTFDKVNPQELAACVATMALMAYVVAEMPERLGP